MSSLATKTKKSRTALSSKPIAKKITSSKTSKGKQAGAKPKAKLKLTIKKKVTPLKASKPAKRPSSPKKPSAAKKATPLKKRTPVKKGAATRKGTPAKKGTAAKKVALVKKKPSAKKRALTKKVASSKKTKLVKKPSQKRTPFSKKGAGKSKHTSGVSKVRSAKSKSAKARVLAAIQQYEQYKHTKPAPSLPAVRAFEQALRAFNRRDFSGAKLTFENILGRFEDQTEIVVRARTYLAICDQRLARTPTTPRGVEALYDRGIFEYNRGNVREAVDLFEKALRQEPYADHVLYSLATAYTRLGNASRALDALRRAISIRSVHRSHARHDPDFSSIRGNLEFQRLAGMEMDFFE